MKKILSLVLLIAMLAGCATNNATQVMATMTGLQAGATLGGAIGGFTSRTPRGHFMGTTIGAVSGAALGAIATSPRRERSYGSDELTDSRPSYSDSYSRPKRKEPRRAQHEPLSGLKRDVRVTNVRFNASSCTSSLSSGEAATVSYDIINVTPVEIPLLVPKVELKRKSSRITVSPMQDIVSIPSGEGVRYTITLTAGRKIKNGDNTLLFYLSSDGGSTYTLMNELPFETIK